MYQVVLLAYVCMPPQEGAIMLQCRAREFFAESCATAVVQMQAGLLAGLLAHTVDCMPMRAPLEPVTARPAARPPQPSPAPRISPPSTPNRRPHAPR